ncbi:MAG: hypothetical protein EOM76_04145 [Sphingobacteriia bacterium]|nr:hypothetical protein [Sphingobacteriia bacterium]
MKQVNINSFSKIPFVLLIVVTTLISSCTAPIPIMQLEHMDNSQPEKFVNKGKIKVSLFEDKRYPGEILRPGIDNVYKTYGRKKNWSKRTDPNMNTYVLSVIESEIEKNNLFSLSDDTEFELTGKLISIKNVHVEGSAAEIMIGIGLGFNALAIITGPSLLGPAVALITAGIVVKASSKHKIQSYVTYDVALSKNGNIIWQNRVDLLIEEKHYLKFKSQKKRSRISSGVLDKTLTQAVRSMFEKMNKEVAW